MKNIIYNGDKVKNWSLIRKRILITVLIIWGFAISYIFTYISGYNNGTEKNKIEVSYLNSELEKILFDEDRYYNNFYLTEENNLKEAFILNKLENSINEYKKIHKVPNYRTISTKDILAYTCISTKKYNLDLIETIAQMAVESDFCIDAISHADCHGLMQLSKGVLEEYNRTNQTNFMWEDIRVPSINIEIGCWYMRYLKNNHNKQDDQTLYCYNAGPYGREGIEESTNYVKKINELKNTIKDSIINDFS